MFEKVKNSCIWQQVLVYFIVTLADFSTVLSSLENNASRVACLGDTVSFDCCVKNGSSTVWGGTAFTHDGLSCSNDDIILLHSRFVNSDYNISYSCLNGAIVAKSLRIEEDCYCSQLNVTINSMSNLHTVLNIQCMHDNGTYESSVANFSVTIVDNDATACSGSKSETDIYQSVSNEEGKITKTFLVLSIIICFNY